MFFARSLGHIARSNLRMTLTIDIDANSGWMTDSRTNKLTKFKFNYFTLLPTACRVPGSRRWATNRSRISAFLSIKTQTAWETFGQARTVFVQ